MRSFFGIAIVIVMLSSSVVAQKQATIIGGHPSDRSRQPTKLSVTDIIKMSTAGFSDEMIIEQLKKNAQPFNLSADEMIRLKNAGVSEPVIRIMLNPESIASVPVVTAHFPTQVSTYPAEIGVYMKHQGRWKEILPEVANWKTGGVVKNVTTLGIVRGDVNGHIEGKHSALLAAQPIEVLVVAPEGVAITEYQLLHLRQNGNNREFRTVTGGVFHVSSGATRDLVQFESLKVASRTFTINLANLVPGEYGLLPSDSFSSRNAAGSRGKLYTFRIAE